MKTVILAVLLLLAVASRVSGDTPDATIQSDDTPDGTIPSDDTLDDTIVPDDNTETGNTTESVKSRYGDERYLPQSYRCFNFIILSLCLITSYATRCAKMQVKQQAF
jgi:hypothetical protein